MTLNQLKEIVDAEIAKGNGEILVFSCRKDENGNNVSTWVESAITWDYGYQEKGFKIVEGGY